MIPVLHLVTNERLIADPALTTKAAAAIMAGGTRVAFHLRGPRSSGRALFDVARALRPIARSAGARFLVNDRVDLALAIEADGVHLGARSFDVPVARELVGESALIGRSVHGRREAETSMGADFLFAGPVYATQSHPDGPPEGLDVIAAAKEGCPEAPVFAIGGVTAERVTQVVDAGAAGVAVIGAWWDSTDPGDAVAELTGLLSSGRVEARAG